MYALPAPRFFRLAHRLSAYAGVMQARVIALLEDEQPNRPQAAPAGPGRRSDTYVPATVDAQSIALDPVLGSLFSVGQPD